ncbi:MAG TPA: hypothetical protein PKD73_12320 [Burkholderiaceae bacterium]|nr:hypothetical protein [Burkholderiaceae bacterium]
MHQPHMAVRSAMPWPVRWALVAVVLGFCAALAWWAFDLGAGLAGLERIDREEMPRLRKTIESMQAELDTSRSASNTAHGLLTASQSAQERLTEQVRQLEAENQRLRGELGFYEKLIPPAQGEGVQIRAFQADATVPGKLRWQLLLMQPQKNPSPFAGQAVFTLTGQLNGKSWTTALPDPPVPVQLTQHARLDGVLELPPGAVVQTVMLRLMQGGALKASRQVKL